VDGDGDGAGIVWIRIGGCGVNSSQGTWRKIRFVGVVVKIFIVNAWSRHGWWWE